MKKRDIRLKKIKKVRNIIKNNVPKGMRYLTRLIRGLEFNRLQMMQINKETNDKE